jgi:hypothetical protein
VIIGVLRAAMQPLELFSIAAESGQLVPYELKGCLSVRISTPGFGLDWQWKAS